MVPSWFHVVPQWFLTVPQLGHVNKRQVQRVIHDDGRCVPKLISRRVLDAKTKGERVAWREGRLVHNAAYWKRRAYGDGHFCHLPRVVPQWFHVVPHWFRTVPTGCGSQATGARQFQKKLCRELVGSIFGVFPLRSRLCVAGTDGSRQL